MISETITFIHEDKTITLIPTAHVSLASVELVKQTLSSQTFDAIFVELDQKRLHAMKHPQDFSTLDLMSVFKRKEVGSLLMHLLLASFQKKIASNLDVPLGAEMKAAVDIASEHHIPLIPMDRDISVTLQRVFSSLTLWQKFSLGTDVLLSIFSSDKIDENAIEHLKQKDILDDALTDLSKKLPNIKRTLIDERDHYMMHKLLSSHHKNIVAIIGAAHAPGMIKAKDALMPINEISSAPVKKKSYWGWIIPITIMVLIGLTFSLNPQSGVDSIIKWVLINGTMSAIGTALVLGHPLAILTAFVAAPISSLSPLLAAGWFAGLAQLFASKPKVDDLTRMGDDILSFKKAFKNKALKVLWVTAMANIFSSIATFIAASSIFETLWSLLFK
jgi:pheromone shutdown-related protein TraB